MTDPTFHRRGDAGYEEGRVGRVFNGRRPDRFPAAVVAPESDAEVVAAVRRARDEGLQVTVRAGGHSWAAWAVRDDVLLIDLGRLGDMSLDLETGIVAVRPAVRGGEELAPYLAAHGRMFPGGHCPTVGLGGFLLQGGQGWNCRTLGWACQSIEAIDVVTADGELVRADASQNSDLLWAARGAGPGFCGAITRFHLRTYPVAAAMTQSNLVFPMALFDEVVTWLHAVLPTLDPLVEPVMAATYGPVQAGMVEAPGDEPVLIVHTTVMADTPPQAAELLAPLNTCPVLDRALLREHAAPTTLAAECEAQALMNPRGARYAADSMWTDAGPSELVPLARDTFATLPTRDSFTIWYGWAPPRERPDMAFSLEGNVYVATYAIWDDPADDEANRDWVTAQLERMAPVSKGLYLGDSDFSRRPDRFMAEKNFARLEEIRAARDPEGRFATYLLPAGATPNAPLPT